MVHGCQHRSKSINFLNYSTFSTKENFFPILLILLFRRFFNFVTAQKLKTKIIFQSLFPVILMSSSSRITSEFF